MFLLVFFDELLESGLAVGDDALVAAVVVVPIRADDGQLKMFQKAKKKKNSAQCSTKNVAASSGRIR